MNKEYYLQEILDKINKATSKYNDYMTDWQGDWLYDERSAIESDLGISLEFYDNLSDLRESIKILIKHGLDTWDSWSAKEMSTLLELK